ncbi:MAG: MarR family transcriptional regulator [Thermoleophilia bacterium]
MPPGDAHEAWNLMLAHLFAHRDRMQAAAAAERLTFAQARGLVMLDAGQAAPMRDLADRLICDASQVTGIVDRLEELGYAERRPSARDRRVKELVVTPAGRQAQERLRQVMADPPPALLGLPARDLATLRRILRRLAVELDLDLSGPMPPAVRAAFAGARSGARAGARAAAADGPPRREAP